MRTWYDGKIPGSDWPFFVFSFVAGLGIWKFVELVVDFVNYLAKLTAHLQWVG